MFNKTTDLIRSVNRLFISSSEWTPGTSDGLWDLLPSSVCLWCSGRNRPWTEGRGVSWLRHSQSIYLPPLTFTVKEEKPDGSPGTQWRTFTAGFLFMAACLWAVTRREYLTGCLHRDAVLTVNEWESPVRIRDLRWTFALLIRLSDDAEGSVNTANPTGQRGRQPNKSSQADQRQGSHPGGQCECIIHILMHILFKKWTYNHTVCRWVKGTVHPTMKSQSPSPPFWWYKAWRSQKQHSAQQLN